MRFLQSLAISSSALTAERLRLNLISNNLANINTTRTAEGGPYRRKIAVFEECLRTATNNTQTPGNGVKVTAIREDTSPLPLIYDPDHPDADSQGFVALPNVNVVNEMVDLITSTRTYEANVNVFNACKSVVLKALDLGRA